MLLKVNFNRVDYAQVGTTSRGCMRLIRGGGGGGGDSSARATKKSSGKQAKFRVSAPPPLPPSRALERRRLQIVVGGHSGVLMCLERLNDDTKV